MKNLKKNLNVGSHALIIRHTVNNGGKYVVFCDSLHHPTKEVQRNFTQGSEALKSFILKLTGKDQSIATDSISSLLKGRMFCGQIGEAKNPKYVDLIRVNWVYKDIPEKCPCCNNSNSSVIDLEATGSS